MATVDRLSAADLTNLAIEAPDTPMHQGVLAWADAGPILDNTGRLRIDAIRGHVEARLERVPRLRRVVRRTPFLHGRPIWVDDPAFRIENHVRVARVEPPGGEAGALAFAEKQMAVLMDRTQPLWQIWLLEGYGAERIGVFIKVHHALADGPAIVNMLGQLFDLEPRPTERVFVTWSPAPPPSTADLRHDSFRGKGRLLLRGVRCLLHPVRTARSTAAVLVGVREALRQARGAPRTSLNVPIGRTRRLGALHVSLGDVREAAHARGVKINDMFLSVLAGALRLVLLGRGEPVDRPVHASVAVSLARRDATTTGNHAGTIVVPIRVDSDDLNRVVPDVARATERAKARQITLASTGLMVFLAQTGITRAFIRRQHMINVLTTNIPGPPVPLYFAGAMLHEPVGLPPIAGNVTLSFAALSYAGGFTLSVVADGSVWPHVELWREALRSSWEELRERDATMVELASTA